MPSVRVMLFKFTLLAEADEDPRILRAARCQIRGNRNTSLFYFSRMPEYQPLFASNALGSVICRMSRSA